MNAKELERMKRDGDLLQKDKSELEVLFNKVSYDIKMIQGFELTKL